MNATRLCKSFSCSSTPASPELILAALREGWSLTDTRAMLDKAKAPRPTARQAMAELEAAAEARFKAQRGSES